MPPTIIDDRYTLVEPLGDGGMAKVYLAHDDVLDRTVALKVLREAYADDEEFVERFRREARSAASLSHPNIVGVYDQGRSESGAYYIAMEYVPQGTLKDRIKRDGSLSPSATAGVALQIADALSAAHEKGVIHRDIKPQNVLVTASGDVKVTDFGIARAASSPMTATSAVLGTAAYMSPEQALGKPVGPGSDLYSLGVVLYEMLTGELPYATPDGSPIALAMKHVNEPVPSLREANPSVPEPLDAVTVKLLSKNPEDRYASATELANDLERVLSGLPTAAVGATAAKETEKMTAPLPADPKGRTRKTTARSPVAAPVEASDRGRRDRSRLLPTLTALLLGALLLGGLAWYFRGDTDAPQPKVPEETTSAGAPVGEAQPSSEAPPATPPALVVQTPNDQPVDVSSGTAASGTAASGTAASGTVASGTAASNGEIQPPSQAVPGTVPVLVQPPSGDSGGGDETSVGEAQPAPAQATPETPPQQEQDQKENLKLEKKQDKNNQNKGGDNKGKG